MGKEPQKGKKQRIRGLSGEGQNTSLRFLSLRTKKWVHPGFVHPESVFKRIDNDGGSFFVLHSRQNLLGCLDPKNWYKTIPMRNEGPKGHIGRRAADSFSVWAKDPVTQKSAQFVMKVNEPEKMRRIPEEIEAAQMIQAAGVRTERPVGYWVKPNGIRYSIFLHEAGKTMLYRKKEDSKVILSAARMFGKLFKAGILQKDTGTKHVMVHEGVNRLFDFEFVEKTSDTLKLQKEFLSFVESALVDGSIRTPKVLHDTLEAYLHEVFEHSKGPERQKLLELLDVELTDHIERIEEYLLQTRSDLERKKYKNRLEVFLASQQLVRMAVKK